MSQLHPDTPGPDPRGEKIVERAIRSLIGAADGPDARDGSGGTGEALTPEDREEVAELGAFLQDCKATLGEQAPGQGPRAQELAERVLGKTTREDLSWYGDLRLVGSFLRASGSLRIAAVALAMHFIGLSVLAYHLLSPSTDPYINVDFEERPTMPYTETIREPAGDLEVPDSAEEPEVREALPADGREPDGRDD